MSVSRICVRLAAFISLYTTNLCKADLCWKEFPMNGQGKSTNGDINLELNIKKGASLGRETPFCVT